MQELKVLYFSYDGALDPLGQNQVLSYIREWSPGIGTVLISFEKPEKLERAEVVDALRETLAEKGIDWIPIRYHSKPPVLSTLWDSAVGIWKAWSIVRNERVDLLHARSIVCGLMAYPVKWLTGLPVVLDTRALWVDERVESGSRIWRWLYRPAKVIEKCFLSWADAVVVLSPAFRRDLETQSTLLSKPIVVIPTCVEIQKFLPCEGNPEFHLVYCGSLGTVYWMEGMVAFFKSLRNRCPDARWLIISRSESSLLGELCHQSGIPEQAITFCEADPSAVPELLRKARMGIAFYREGRSSLGRCPTKIGEYLASGLPVVMNRSVGEWGEIVEKEGCGVLVSENPDKEELDHAVEQLIQLESHTPDLRNRCRSMAKRFFSMEEGTRRYTELYKKLLLDIRGTGL